MELRLLYGNELQWALYTANEVFETCIRPVLKTQEEAEQYYRFSRVEYLWQEMSTGRLFLWGAFENGQMCAVSAMQNTGHIIMLYVRRPYMGRRVGMRLLEEMSVYALEVLGRDRVTIDVASTMSASYFYHVGFVPLRGDNQEEGCVHLERETWRGPQKFQKQEVTYPVKKVSPKIILGMVAGLFMLAAVLLAGTTIYHIAQDGLWTEEGP
ncbi:MAG: GNAT family N-acetyltransferase [Roseburia sp.]